MTVLLDWLPIAATLFAVPQFLPQLVSVWRTGDVAGVSWSWAALTSISNGGWIVYFFASQMWSAVVPASSATVLAGILAVLLGRRGVPYPAAAIAGGWACLLGFAGAVAGRTGLGTVLTVSFVLQVAPSVWKAYRTDRPTGIARGTWLLILAELFCWGVYGIHASDPRLIVLGWTGVAASMLVLIRVREWHRRAADRHIAPASKQRPEVHVDWATTGHTGAGSAGAAQPIAGPRSGPPR